MVSWASWKTIYIINLLIMMGIVTLDDGTEIKSRVNLSKAIKPRID